MKLVVSFFAFLILTSSCTFLGDNGSLDGPGPISGDGTSTAGSIELTGSQTEPLTLTNHNPDPTLPDYCISGHFDVNAAITVQPGVTICLKEDAEIRVNSAGSWNATGTATSPITIKGLMPVAGYWNSINFYSGSTSNKLIYVNFSDGGGNVGTKSTVYGDLGGRLFMDYCSITRSLLNGINIQFYDFELTLLDHTNITSCALAPIRIQLTQMAAIGEFNTYSGNGANYIETIGGSAGFFLSTTGVIKKTSIPFYISGLIGISSNVTINPGARFKMSSTGKFWVTPSGSLNAIGTASEMIKFEGENPIAGSWAGIYFENSNSTNNIIRYCELSYGGNDSGTDALIFMRGPTKLKLGNSIIHDSQSWGLRNEFGSGTFTNEGGNTLYNNASGNIGT